MQKAHRRAGIAVAAAGVLLATAACGGSSSGGGGTNNAGGGDQTIIWGSTDKPVSYDPAKAYDLPSWNVIYNVYQTLVRVNPDTLKTEPDAAESCDPSKDFKTWTCTLKAGLTFSNGDPVTAQDVKFSFDRLIKINDPSGPVRPARGDGSRPRRPTTRRSSSTSARPTRCGTTSSPPVPARSSTPRCSRRQGPRRDDKIVGSGPYKLESYQPQPDGAVRARTTSTAGDLQLSQRRSGDQVLPERERAEARRRRRARSTSPTGASAPTALQGPARQAAASRASTAPAARSATWSST